jgi:hypothetical protein
MNTTKARSNARTAGSAVHNRVALGARSTITGASVIANSVAGFLIGIFAGEKETVKTITRKVVRKGR